MGTNGLPYKTTSPNIVFRITQIDQCMVIITGLERSNNKLVFMSTTRSIGRSHDNFTVEMSFLRIVL